MNLYSTYDKITLGAKIKEFGGIAINIFISGLFLSLYRKEAIMERSMPSESHLESIMQQANTFKEESSGGKR